MNNRFSAFGAGLVATALLQSSTATGLIVSGLTANAMLDLLPGLAVMLGANVGTTLMAQILAFNISPLTPILILIGVIAFRNSKRAQTKDIGRVFIGLGLMLFALSQINSLLTAVAASEATRTLLALISGDVVMTMLLGALLAWAMHSSLAMVMLTATLAGTSLIPLETALALVLGANLGSAINPVLGALGHANPSALRLPAGNLFTRLTGCLIALPLIGFAHTLPPALLANRALSVVNFHLVFNLFTALLFFPFLPLLARGLERYLRDRPSDDPATARYLEVGALSQPPIAINNAVREVMRMTDVCEAMLRDTGEAFLNPDRDRIGVIKRTDDILDRLNRQVIAYLSALNPEALTEADRQRTEDVLAFSMNLEHIGDIISSGLIKRAAKRIKRQLVFSEDDQHEMDEMFERIAQNIRLASAAFMTSEDRAIQLLYEQKQLIEDLEISDTRAHFNRLRDGRPESLDTRTLHLDVMRDLKLINAQLVGTARQVRRA